MKMQEAVNEKRGCPIKAASFKLPLALANRSKRARKALAQEVSRNELFFYYSAKAFLSLLSTS